MAAKKQLKKKNIVGKPMPIENFGLHDYTREAMTLYGETSIEDRALPDFRDGFKPVQRRALYATYKIGLTAGSVPKKAARIVGDTIGKFHPHGDSSVYSTMVNMVNSPVPPMFGKGNWGGLNDPPAAMRYTNAKLSLYGEKVFFNPDYMKVVKMGPNYDGSMEEPIVLPALMPNILINGTFGIAVAATSHIPPFKPEGIAKLVQLILDGKQIDEKDCMKHLEFNYQYGSHPALDTKEQRLELKRLFKTGEGSVLLVPEYKYDQKLRKLTIIGFPPNLDSVKVMGKLLEKRNIVASVEDATDKTTRREQFEIVLKKGVKDKDIKWVLSNFSKKMNYKVNVTIRKYVPEKEQTRAKFKSVSIPKLLIKWVKWRTALEKRVLQMRLDRVQKEIAYSELMILAVDNKKVVIESLDKENSESHLVKKLKITEEQASTILDNKIRSLRKMDKKVLTDKLSKQKQEEKVTQGYIKKPQQKISVDLAELIKGI